ncbi:dTDP-4-dehydrorhamnose 3,5-epimerase family protein [Alphaproteobacteria bacterium]|nr:dTDP-4-dehydrorhamnose 3,5-epimerase family protein [Alphaproteobacteria bacterium]
MMKLQKTPIDDLFIIKRNIFTDARGSFTRLYGDDEIKAAGRQCSVVHINSSTSKLAGTIRGIHFQYPPFEEEKIVSCTAGAIWDVGIDLRPNSRTQFQWYGVELTPENGLSMIIPKGFGHAFYTLEPNTTAVYAVSQYYSVNHEGGIRFDDPILDIKWPGMPSVVSSKDKSWPPLKEQMKMLNEKFKK